MLKYKFITNEIKMFVIYYQALSYFCSVPVQQFYRFYLSIISSVINKDTPDTGCRIKKSVSESLDQDTMDGNFILFVMIDVSRILTLFRN